MSASVYDITPEQQVELARIDAGVVPNRSCGTCSLCCKVVSIPIFGKAAGQWCSHAKPGKGCGIHATRPFVCRGFYCHWMLTPGLGPEWKPDVAKFLISTRNNGMRITAHVDKATPHAWRREPYYSTFKAWAVKAAAQRPYMHLIDVMIGEQLTVILPDRDVEFGVIGEDETVDVVARTDGKLDARVIKRTVAAVPAA
jgi:hypothetical protein